MTFQTFLLLMLVSILMQCDHPNIVKLYAAIEYEGKVYMIMEYASRGNLYNHLKKSSKKKFSEEKVAAYFRDILAAFEYLHTMHPPIIHRDLKPENILIDENQRLKLADFGWSREQQTDRTTFCGTPDYLAPEMIDGSEQTAKLDIWTMGVLMYELLHGKPPFAVEKKVNPIEKINDIQKNIKEGKIKFNDDLSEEAKEVIECMLKPIPEERPIAIEILTFPFFTNYYPILRSINVKSANNGSRVFFNRSRASGLQSTATVGGSNIVGNVDKEVSVFVLKTGSVVQSEDEDALMEEQSKILNRREKELKVMEASIEAKRQFIENRARVVDEDKTALENQKRELVKREAQLNEQEKQNERRALDQENRNLVLNKRNADLEEKEREMNHERSKLEENRMRVEAMEEETKAKDQELENREAQILDLEEEQSERDKALNQIEMDLGIRKEDMNAKEHELDQREAELKAREEEFEAKERETNSGMVREQSEVQKLRESVAKREQNLNKIEQEWKKKNENLVKREKDLGENLLDFQAKETELEAISQELVEREIELQKAIKNPGITESQMNQIEDEHSKKQTNLQEELNKKNEIMKQMEQQLKHRRLEIARCKAKISRLDEENNKLKTNTRNAEQKLKQKAKAPSRFKKKKIVISEQDFKIPIESEDSREVTHIEMNGRTSFGIQHGRGVVRVEGDSPLEIRKKKIKSKPQNSDSKMRGRLYDGTKRNQQRETQNPESKMNKYDHEGPRRSQNLKKMRRFISGQKNESSNKKKNSSDSSNPKSKKIEKQGKYGGVIMENEHVSISHLSDNAAIQKKQENILNKLDMHLNQDSIVSIDKTGLLPAMNNAQTLGVDFRQYTHQLLDIINNTGNILKTTRQTDPQSNTYQPNVLEEIKMMKRSLIDFQSQIDESNPNDNQHASPNNVTVNQAQNPSHLTNLDYTMDSENPSRLGHHNYRDLVSNPSNILEPSDRNYQRRNFAQANRTNPDSNDDRPSMYLQKKNLSPLKMTREIKEREIQRPPNTAPEPIHTTSTFLGPDHQSKQNEQFSQPDLPSYHQEYPILVIQKNSDNKIQYEEPQNLLTKKKEIEFMNYQKRLNPKNSVKAHLTPNIGSYQNQGDDFGLEKRTQNSYKHSVEGPVGNYTGRGRHFPINVNRPFGSEKVGLGGNTHSKVAVVKGTSGAEVFLKVHVRDDSDPTGDPRSASHRERLEYNPNMHHTLEDFFKSTEEFMKWKDTNQWGQQQEQRRAQLPNFQQAHAQDSSPRFQQEPEYKHKRPRNSREIRPKTMESHDEVFSKLMQDNRHQNANYTPVGGNLRDNLRDNLGSTYTHHLRKNSPLKSGHQTGGYVPRYHSQRANEGRHDFNWDQRERELEEYERKEQVAFQKFELEQKKKRSELHRILNNNSRS